MNKLSFSINGWKDYSWQDFVTLAEENGFCGIELHNVIGSSLYEKDGPFHKYNSAATVRSLNDKGISVPCVDISVDVSDSNIAENREHIRKYIEFASSIRSPYVRVYASGESENARENVLGCLSEITEFAAEKNVTVLIETTGMFRNTAALRDILIEFACDSVAALWDMYHTFCEEGEDPEKTITNLGAYIKHVHIKDSAEIDGKREYCLMGEGEIPTEIMINALASVNYDGFISLEWNPDWMEDLKEIDVIYAHFYQYMQQFQTPSRKKSHLYRNKRGTGNFVWKKEALIRKTFSQVLDTMVEEFPDQYAFKYTTLNYTRTYAQFRDDVDECCRAFLSMGIRPGSHVAVWATNIPQWYIAFWAATKLGAVLVTMNTAYKIHEAEYLLKQSDTHTLILVEGYRDSHYAEIIGELCPELEALEPGKPLHSKRLPFLRNVITVGFKKKGCLEWDEAIARSENVPLEEVYRIAATVNPDDVCNMQYTSGTTGFPKGVMLTHYNVVNNGKCIGDRMDLSTADRMMIQVPMFHCFGMVLAMTASMTHGVTLSPIPYFTPKPALACINQEKITCFHGVPTMFIALLEHPDFPKTDFSYMRTGIMAGSPCPISVMQDVVNKMNMKEITIVYGQTEASPGCTMSSTDDSLEVRVSTVGRALPEIECKIVDPETGEDMPVGETGEFVARGYNIMKGYYKMPKATAAAIDKQGWLHTGDLACKTEDGNYKITGRLKDMIIRGGENIYPKEIEEFIYTHEKVKDVQVIGVPDEQYGEEIAAWIVLKDGVTMTEDEMKQYIRDHMAKHKVPKYIDFVSGFPMNVAGKILKYKMREEAIEKYGLQKADSVVTA
ncbi:MAG: AMP-dependent synthetase [Ruminococcaceae bacterium]|nr:AMP-dependent synthetase [Oscillospiraceae bacterium]